MLEGEVNNMELFTLSQVHLLQYVHEKEYTIDKLLYGISERQRTKPSDVEWLKTVANSGTLGDKIAALAVQIQVINQPVVFFKI